MNEIWWNLSPSMGTIGRMRRAIELGDNSFSISGNKDRCCSGHSLARKTGVVSVRVLISLIAMAGTIV